MQNKSVGLISPAFNSRGEIRSLTGLRGLAAILVVVFHFTQNNAFFQLDDSSVPALIHPLIFGNPNEINALGYMGPPVNLLN